MDGLEARELWKRAHLEADLARAELSDALHSLAQSAVDGPDGLGGKRILAEAESGQLGLIGLWRIDWTGDPVRDRLQFLRSLRAAPEVGPIDWAGDTIMEHYLWEGGRPIVINNDPAWSGYMTDNQSLSGQVRA